MTGTTGLSDLPSSDCRLGDQAHAPRVPPTEQARDLTPKVKAIVIGTGTAGLPMALRAARHGYQIGVGIKRLHRVATARAIDGTPGSPESSTASIHPRAGAGSRHPSALLCTAVGWPMTLDAPCNRGFSWTALPTAGRAALWRFASSGRTPHTAESSRHRGSWPRTSRPRWAHSLRARYPAR